MSKSKFFTGVKKVTEEEVVASNVEVEVAEPVVEVEVAEPVVDNMDGIAFSLKKNPKDGLFYVVKIKFDIVNNKVGEMEFVGAGVPERFVAIENFKINVARARLV